LMNEPILASEEEIGLNIARKSVDGMSEAEQRANASRLSGLTLGKIGSKDEEKVIDVEKMAQIGEGSLDDVTMGAAANEIQKAFTGTDDPLGRIWTKDHKGFKDGAEYLRLMKDVFVNGPQAAMTPEMREYMKATPEEQTKIAWEGLGKLKQSMEIGGALVSKAASFLFPREAGANAPLDEREEKVAPKDIQEASYIVSEDRRMLGKTSFSPELVEEAREKLVKWRSERDDERMRSMHLQKLAKDNAWSQVPAVLASLKGDARTLAQELIDNPDKKPEEYASRLEALTTDEIEAVGQVRRLVKPVNESGFWNTIGDAALQFAMSRRTR